MAKKSAAAVVDGDVEVIERESTELVFTKVQPGLAIEANFGAVMAHIQGLVAVYDGLVVTEDYLPQAKKDRAYLNGLKSALTQRYRDVKREFMAPVDALDRQIKELQAPIEAASLAIDEQVKAFEAREKADKRVELVKHYEEFAGALVDVVPFERIEDPAWLNKTCNLMAAFDSIEAAISRIARDDATLDGLGLTHLTDAKTTYFETLDLSAAIARSKTLDAADERTRALESEKAAIAAYREEAAEKAKEAAPVAEPSEVVAPAPVVEPVAEAPEQVATYVFTIECTRTQADDMVAYLRSVGLTGTVRREARP